MTRDSRAVADQLGLLLQRRVRRNLYVDLVRGVHPAVDVGAYPILSGIARVGEASAAGLAADIGVDRALISRRAALLVQAGLLRTSADPDDRRVSVLSLTEAGEDVVTHLRRRLEGVIDDRLRDWPAPDRRQLAQLLTRLVDALGASHGQQDVEHRKS